MDFLSYILTEFCACGYVRLNTWDRQTLLLASLIIGKGEEVQMTANS